jgi:hypothetical protein
VLWLLVPEKDIHHSQHCGNLKSCKRSIFPTLWFLRTAVLMYIFTIWSWALKTFILRHGKLLQDRDAGRWNAVIFNEQNLAFRGNNTINSFLCNGSSYRISCSRLLTKRCRAEYCRIIIFPLYMFTMSEKQGQSSREAPRSVSAAPSYNT